MFFGFFSKILATSTYVQFLLTTTASNNHPGQTPVPLHQFTLHQDRFASLSRTNVSLPHDNPTKSFWTHGSPDANPLANEGSKGPFMTDADVVIIGSGITGVGAAYHLSKLLEATDISLNILILEARDFCSGATGRNGGHLTPNPFLGFRSIAEKYNTDEALRWLALENHTAESVISILQSSGHAAEVDLVHSRHLGLFFSDTEENEAKKHWEAAKKAGVNLAQVQFLSKEETRQLYGPAFPSVCYSGSNLWPLKAVTHFFRLAQQRLVASTKGRLHIHTQTPVISITRLNTQNTINTTAFYRRWSLRTPRGSVRAHTVIHATNGYAAHLLPSLSAHARHRIVPTRGQVIATRANVGIETLQTSSFGANDGFEYWFPRPINKKAVEESEKYPLVIFGGGRESSGPGYELGTTDDSVVNPAVSKTLRKFLPQIYPEGWFQKGKEPEMEWAGIMGYTESGDPLVGAVVDYDDGDGTVLDGQYIAAGYSGHGMPRAFGCAEALAQMIISDLKNETWQVPIWFPKHFLTLPRDDR